MAYIGAPPQNRVLSSDDIAQGAVTLNDINFTDQPTNMDITGVIDKHTMRLADGVTITGDVTISDDLVLSKISDDGNAITMTNDTSTRTITGSGSIEASTLSQTPNQSLTGMTGDIGSAVTGGAGLLPTGVTSLGTVTTGTLGSGVTFPTGMLRHVTQLIGGSSSGVDIVNDVAYQSKQVTVTSGSLVKLEFFMNYRDNTTGGSDHHLISFIGGTGSGMDSTSPYQFVTGMQYAKADYERGSVAVSFITEPVTTTTPTYTIQFGGTAAPTIKAYHTSFTITEIYQ